MRKLPVRILLVILLLSVCPLWASDPLPSWSDSAPKKAILELVTQVTDPRSPGFVPVGERIATFDNDGTLWSEQPYYFQGYFYLARIETLAPSHPEWQTREPFASLIKGDFTAFAQGGNRAMAAVFTAAHAGFTPGQFQESAEAWIEEARHPQTGLLFTQMVYQPMLEVISYLQSKGFKVYIVSGGDLDFMRPWTDKVYHIPPEQVIGTGSRYGFSLEEGRAELVGLPDIDFICDGEGKPLAINRVIGKRPLASFGNSDGDVPMLQWTDSGSKPHLCLLVHHTDAVREWAYDRESAIGHLEKGLEEASKRGWTVVDMKNDWITIYPRGAGK